MATPRTPLIPLSAYPTGEAQLMPSFQHLLALNTIFNILRGLLAPRNFVASEVAILTDRGDWRAHVIPDVFVVLDAGELDPVYGVVRQQYRLWDEAHAPHLVIEAASRSTVGRDRVGKKEDYAAMGVAEYVQFDPLGGLLTPRLQVFALGADGVYEAVPALADEAVPSQVLPYDWVREGDLLRVRDRVTGALVPTAREQADWEAARANQEAARASQEAARANQEAARANQEAARANQEAVRASQEAARADAAEAVIARLRADIARLSGDAPHDEGSGLS